MRAIVCFASRDPMVNANTFEVTARFLDHRRIPLAQMDAHIEGDTIQAYRRALTDPMRRQPNFLVTADPAPREIGGRVNQAFAEAAARSLGFAEFATITLADGRSAYVWWRERPLPAT